MVDYSKWKNIEISDDEDDTHPNIDTPSLFRWRHQARVERMDEMEREKEAFKLRKQSYQARLIEMKELMKKKDPVEDTLKEEFKKIQLEGKELDREERELFSKERNTPLNVDTISKPGFEKTVLNKKQSRKDENLSEEEKEVRMKEFVKKNEKLCKHYGMLRKYDDSKEFLSQNPDMVSEYTANYLVIWSINLELQEKHELMAHVAHQCICMEYILELAKQLDVDPRSCVRSFFTKIQDCLPDYRAQFEQEIESFKERIAKRAQEKIKAAEEEERLQRLGPGGLDPNVVFEELPDDLKTCFETRDVGMLKKTIAAMPVELAKYHMKRCIDSGLWVANAGEDFSKDDAEPSTSKDAAEAAAPTEETKAECDAPETKDAASEEEPVYASVGAEEEKK